MYSGRVRNPKELSAMQDDVAALARAKSALEDEALALYERAERLEVDATDAKRDLDTSRRDAEQQEHSYRDAVAQCEREIASLEAQREELASGIDEDILRRYDRLRPQKGGVAVVVVRPDGVCDGCHVAVPERVVSRLRHDPDGVQTCDGCGRILVLPSPN
jgi:predicted  nucleic acid-binding Zn-ribbon protein